MSAAEGQRAQSRRAHELDAWDEVARSLCHLWRFAATDSAVAIATLCQAVENYPGYAPTHSMLACALLISSYVGWTSPNGERDLAILLAHRAVALDGRTVDPLQEFERAMRMSPRDPFSSIVSRRQSRCPLP